MSLKKKMIDIADYLEKREWRYPSLGEYPEVDEWEPTSRLVPVFWWSVDSTGKKAKVYGLDRWARAPYNEWEKYNDHDIVAWQYLPEAPEVEE